MSVFPSLENKFLLRRVFIELMQRAVGETNLTSSNQTCDQDLANSQLAVLLYHILFEINYLIYSSI